MEAKATYLCYFQAQVVHGLLQTEGYARALRGARFENDLDGLVAARIERQRILERDHPPLFWVVMSEAALRQEIGGSEVMREQLTDLLAMQEREWVKIQILPFEVGAHAGSHGSFNLLRFASDPDLVYTEDFVQGHMTVDSAAFREGSLRYDHLRAAALSVEDSTTLITRVMEEHYGDQPGPGGSPLA